jgi:hypothetical protein
MAFLSLLAASLAALAASSNPVQVDVSPSGDFTLSIAGWTNFSLSGAGVGLMVDSTWLSSSDGSLVMVGALSPASGSDAWGAWSGSFAGWAASSSPSTVLLYTTWRSYADVPAVAFQQLIVSDVSTGGAYAQRNGISSAFPSFAVPLEASSDTAFLEYGGTFVDNSVSGPTVHPWGGAGNSWNSGLTSGPAVFFDAGGENALVFSALSNFMAASSVQVPGNASAQGSIRTGLVGSFTTLPAGTTLDSVAFYGAGINAAMMAWGTGLLEFYGKPATGPQNDFTNTHLVYNTDHRARRDTGRA